MICLLKIFITCFDSFTHFENKLLLLYEFCIDALPFPFWEKVPTTVNSLTLVLCTASKARQAQQADGGISLLSCVPTVPRRVPFFSLSTAPSCSEGMMMSGDLSSLMQLGSCRVWGLPGACSYPALLPFLNSRLKCKTLILYKVCSLYDTPRA